jgi:guanosine-3',5'-bis(diphosphate) 3'-pyrophosphohydrolase
MEINAALFNEAIIFASKKHRGQLRKGDGRPYILHPMEVVHVLYEVKVSKNMFLLGIAAILHDVVEDCGVTLKEIAKRFGYQVAALVEELTLLKDNYDKIGKTKYLCQEVVKMTSYALCIKLCDRLCNIRDMKNMKQEFIDKYVPETWEILAAVKTRKITGTHKRLIKLIETELKKYNKESEEVK